MNDQVVQPTDVVVPAPVEVAKEPTPWEQVTADLATLEADLNKAKEPVQPAQ